MDEIEKYTDGLPYPGKVFTDEDMAEAQHMWWNVIPILWVLFLLSITAVTLICSGVINKENLDNLWLMTKNLIWWGML